MDLDSPRADLTRLLELCRRAQGPRKSRAALLLVTPSVSEESLWTQIPRLRLGMTVEYILMVRQACLELVEG